jgi:hypothetical protein
VTIAWKLAQAPERARLEILDSAGTVLRTYEPDTTKVDSLTPTSTRADTVRIDSLRLAARAARRYAGTPLPKGAGLQHLVWDLRAQGIESFPGMILWGAGTNGPAVPPGRYTVRLVVGPSPRGPGRTLTAPVTVERNPLITDVSVADMRAQFDFGRRVRAKANEANQAVIAIRHVKTQLDDRLERSKDATLAAKGATLRANSSAVEEDIYQVRNRSGQDPLNFPIKVNNRLATLLSMSEQGDGRPTNNMPAIFGILSKELDGYTTRLAEVWRTDLSAVNRELGRLKLPPIDPKCARKEGCAVAQ